MTEFEERNEGLAVTADRIRIFLPRDVEPQNSVQASLLSIDVEKLDTFFYDHIKGGHLAISYGKSATDALEIVGEVLPLTNDENELQAIFERLQQTLEDVYDDPHMYFEEVGLSSYIRIDNTTAVEIRRIGGDEPHVNAAIGLRSLSNEQLAAHLAYVPESVEGDIPSLAKGKSTIEEVGKIWAYIVDSVLPPVEIMSPQSVYSINLMQQDITPFNVYINKTHILMDIGRKKELAREAALDTFSPDPIAERTLRLSDFDAHFEAFGGLDGVKDQLRTMAAPLIDPESARDYNIATSHFYLYGPPGAGKTSLIKAFAQGVGGELYTIIASDIDDAYHGEAAKNVAKRINLAIDNKIDTMPLIIFIDEIDTLIGKRSDTQGHFQNIIKALNTELDRLTQDYTNQVIIVGATNSDPSDLDASVTRSGRLEGIQVPLPTRGDLRGIWGTLMVQSVPATQEVLSMYTPDIDLDKLATKSEGMSGADVQKILDIARREKYGQLMRTGNSTLISQQDLTRIVATFHHN